MMFKKLALFALACLLRSENVEAMQCLFNVPGCGIHCTQNCQPTSHDGSEDEVLPSQSKELSDKEICDDLGKYLKDTFVTGQDEKFIVSACHDQTIRIWGLENSKVTKVLRGHVGLVTCVKVIQDELVVIGSIQQNMILFSGSDDMTVKIWDVYTGECLVTLKGSPGPVKRIEYSCDDNSITAWSEKNEKTMWKLECATSDFLEPINDHKPTSNDSDWTERWVDF